MSNFKIVLLGNTGFVGKNVAEEFKERGLIFSCGALSSGLDIRDVNQISAFLKSEKPDYIINCAAHVGSLNYVTEKAATVIIDNTRMIMSMYEAIATECPKTIVINPIANCAYPAKADTFVEDHWWDGHLHRSVLSYGATRRMLWATGESFYMQYGIRSIHLLVPNMYGPYDSTDPNKAHALNALISKFVKAKQEDKASIDIWGTGIAIREWLYAKDFARIVCEIIENPTLLGIAEPINIGQNFGLSVRELVEVIRTTFQYKGDVTWDHSKPDGAPKKVMDDTRFKKVFKDFTFTRFEEGISKTVNYYNSIYPY